MSGRDLPERPLEPSDVRHPPRIPVCPVCGCECAEIYRTARYADVVGCDICLYSTPAEDYLEEMIEAGFGEDDA